MDIAIKYFFTPLLLKTHLKRGWDIFLDEYYWDLGTESRLFTDLVFVK